MDDTNIVALLIVGILAGTAAASVTSGRRKQSFEDLIRNTVIGVFGAIVGTLLFTVLGIELGGILDTSISLAQLLTAFVGAVIVIFVARFIRR